MEDIKLQGYSGRRILVFCQDHDHYHFQLRLLDQEFCHVFRFPLKAICYSPCWNTSCRYQREHS